MAGAGDGFEVVPEGLRDVALILDGDALDVGNPGTEGAQAAASAVGACGNGPLAAALSRFAVVLAARTTVMTDATTGAADTLRSNASTYRDSDTSAAGGLDKMPFDDVPSDIHAFTTGASGAGAVGGPAPLSASDSAAGYRLKGF